MDPPQHDGEGRKEPTVRKSKSWRCLLAVALLGSSAPAARAEDCVAIEAGPIWNQADALAKCPGTCRAHGEWNREWWTTVPGRMSVCQCCPEGSYLVNLEAGPIWNQTHAATRCPEVCGEHTWTREWWTTVQGQMSVCQCRVAGCTAANLRLDPMSIMPNGTIRGDSPFAWHFSWCKVPNAEFYELYVMGPHATRPFVDVAGLTEPYYDKASLSGYIAAHNLEGWTWKVRARVDGEYGPWSEGRFDVVPPIW
jgi:hypothetical protein